MANNKPKARGVREVKIELDDAATLLGKERVAIERLVQQGQLRVLPSNGGTVTVSLEDVLKIRHAWWQAVADLILDIVRGFEDESLAQTLDEVKLQRATVERSSKRVVKNATLNGASSSRRQAAR
ncbi:hypothetical protein [Paraburkholderia tropica]|uniref:hypothetical protein n=1 Tax=Paraburkholderia tropica TaxID=92647 RepID=UPI0015927678|nr:hypothetical protein [Paraburkholderia tropica]